MSTPTNAKPVYPYWTGNVQYELDTTLDNVLYGEINPTCCDIQPRKKNLPLRGSGNDATAAVAAPEPTTTAESARDRDRDVAAERRFLVSLGAGIMLILIAAGVLRLGSR